MKGADRLAAEARRAAEVHPRDEAGFRAEAERALLAIAAEHGVTLEPQLEVTLATGIADAVFNRMIVEWEPPGKMAASPGHRGNVHAVEQVRNYVDGLAARERRTLERLSGVACDGNWMIFCRYRAGRWIVDDPVPVDESSAAQLLRTLLAAQTGRALIADNLLRDFSADALLTRQLARELLAQLDVELGQRPDGLPARLFRQWEILFAVATGVTGEGRKPLDLTLYEIGNVIVRAWRAALQEHERALRALQALCGEPIVPALEDHIGAAQIARDEGITLYDAMYVAIARRLGAALISLDERDLLSRELAISPTAATAQLLGSEKGRRSDAPTSSEN